MISSDRRSEK